MSVSFTNDVQPTFSLFILSYEFTCSNFTVGRDILTSFSFTYTLFTVPLSIFILYLGFQRWKQKRSVSSAAVMTHSDFFTYNMAVMELISVFGYTFYHCSSYAVFQYMWLLGVIFRSYGWVGQILFPILICADHYLAVVHPIIYRGLRQSGGVNIRNTSSSCIWLIGFVWVGFLLLLYIHNYYNLVPSIFMLIISLIIIVFCSLSVLRVLIRPRPGNVGRDKFDKSKQRAIRTIQIIMVVLWLKLGGSVVAIIIRLSALVIVKCVGEGSVLMLNLVSSLVLHLLFLHRAGKL